MRRGEAADRADREVDLADQQHADDAERDDADRRAVEEQVHEVVRCDRKTGLRLVKTVQMIDEADDDRQRAQVAGADAVDEGADRAADARRAWRDAARRCGRAAVPVGRAHAPFLRRPASRPAARGGPARDGVVGGAGDRGDQLVRSRRPGVKMPLLRPSRSTTMRSATARTSSMLWLIMMTPRPRVAQPLDQVQHLGGLRHAQGRGRLVEHDELRVEQQRAGDRHGLPLAAGERGDRRRARSGCGADELVAAASRRGPPSPPRRAATGRARWPRKMLRDDVEVLAEREILEHGGDAEVERGARVASVTALPSKVIVPERRLVDAGEDLDQRRLAGAVVADQRHDLAGVDVEVDVGQRRDRAEVLARRRAGSGSARRRVAAFAVSVMPACLPVDEGPAGAGRPAGIARSL